MRRRAAIVLGASLVASTGCPHREPWGMDDGGAAPISAPDAAWPALVADAAAADAPVIADAAADAPVDATPPPDADCSSDYLAECMAGCNFPWTSSAAYEGSIGCTTEDFDACVAQCQVWMAGKCPDCV